MVGGGVGGLLPGVGFGLGGEAELARDVGRGAGPGAFGLAGAGFELAAAHAADDGGFRHDKQYSTSLIWSLEGMCYVDRVLPTK